MSEHQTGYSKDNLPPDPPYPSAKERLLADEFDTGERWPKGFDAVTILRQTKLYFKADGARRALSSYFLDHNDRDGEYLYGVIWHLQGEETRSLVMVDIRDQSMHAKFLAGYVAGSPEQGYDVAQETIETLQNDKCCEVEDGHFLTYFKAPKTFQPVEGGALGMMIGAMRDKYIEQGRE